MSGRGTEGLFSYPDIVVVCGEPECHDALRDVILNPTVIVEVLSPATEAFDRGEKFTRYQTWNPTLSDYVLVRQDRPQIEHYHRESNGGWSYHRHAGLEASVAIESIQCTLKLADVYDRSGCFRRSEGRTGVHQRLPFLDCMLFNNLQERSPPHCHSGCPSRPWQSFHCHSTAAFAGTG